MPEIDIMKADTAFLPPTVATEQAVAVVPETPPAPESASAAVLSMIAQASSDDRVDPAKMRELLALRREVMQEEAAIEAQAAFQRVCRNMPRITKRGMIEYGKKDAKPIPYAKWEDIADAIKPIYEAEHFTLGWNTIERPGGGVIVTAILTHRNRHTFTSDFPVPLDTSGGKQNVQGMGSAGSYGRRYSTTNLFGLIFEDDPADDDGKLAGDPRISDEQAEEIAQLVDATDSDPAAFMIFVFGDELPHTFGDIRKSQFVRAKNALLNKRRKQEEDAKKTPPTEDGSPT